MGWAAAARGGNRGKGRASGYGGGGEIWGKKERKRRMLCEKDALFDSGSADLGGKVGKCIGVRIGRDLSDNAISGTIPAPLGDLEHLLKLNLSKNHITGFVVFLLQSFLVNCHALCEIHPTSCPSL
ncbi:hypothetical protein Droror1_Dr00000384 [Drosera rotundifolia]